jgi:hypothetical protein
MVIGYARKMDLVRDQNSYATRGTWNCGKNWYFSGPCGWEVGS